MWHFVEFCMWLTIVILLLRLIDAVEPSSFLGAATKIRQFVDILKGKETKTEDKRNDDQTSVS